MARKICAERRRVAQEKSKSRSFLVKSKTSTTSKARIAELKGWKKPACNPERPTYGGH